ncbi:MAG: hypothetical protein GY729_11995 [Desulfobacteraceae bacterium]|nr:hypothetical protein [Desulfobacteraceae bacterium]
MDILFEKGRIADIHWKNRPVSKKLANILIKNKILTEKEALQALAHQKKSVQRLGTILHTLGYVSKKDITKALTAHTVESVQAVSSMGKGEFAFFNQSSGNFKRSFGQYIDFEKLYNEFGVRHDQSHYLKNAIESAIQPSDDPNLFILPSGAVPSNPAEIIGSERSKFLIEYLTSLFDLIIIDTPPVMQATDALLAAPWTDGTILVIQSGRTEKKTIKEVLAYYKTARQPVLGTVLNRINSKSEGYYKYNTNYYPTYRGQ